MFIPAKAREPVPAFIIIVNRRIKDSDPARHFLSPFYPAETLISRGYACAAFRIQEVAPNYDEKLNYSAGLRGVCPSEARVLAALTVRKPGHASKNIRTRKKSCPLEKF